VAAEVPGVVILRLDGPLFFANVGVFTDRVADAAARVVGARDGGGSGGGSSSGGGEAAPLRAVILDMSGVPSIDSSGVHTLQDTLPAELLRLAGIRARAASSTAAGAAASGGTTVPGAAAAQRRSPPTPPRLFLVGVHGPVRDRLLAGEAAHVAAHAHGRAAGSAAAVAWHHRALEIVSTCGGACAPRVAVTSVVAAVGAQAGGGGGVEEAGGSLPTAAPVAAEWRGVTPLVLARPARAAAMLRQVDVAPAVDAVLALLAKEDAGAVGGGA
jgi:hypothetical protein